MAADTADGAAPASRPHRGAGPRTRLVIAILIAATSVLAGVATWRSDTADRARSDALTVADLQARERQGVIEEIDANLNDSRITLVRVRVNARRGAALDAEAHARGVSPTGRRRARALAAGYQAMARVIRERIDPNVLDAGATPAAFKKARAVLIATVAARRDLDPKPELKQAADHNQRSDDLRLLGVAALICALLLTCSEVLRSRWYRLFLALEIIALLVTTGFMITVGFAA
jgi:hypothetical protein